MVQLHMDTNPMRRRLAGAALTLLLVAGPTAPARADLWTGSCALRVTLSFDTAVRPPLGSPSYDIDAEPAADLDLTTGGIQPCVRTLSSEAFGTTSASGNGDATAWSCGATFARGSWIQTFDAEGPQPFSGTHVLTGSWGNWVLQVQSPSLNVVGIGDFTLQAAEATKTPSCATGSLQSVTMVGVLVFQDP
jgi:hypothetical protein